MGKALSSKCKIAICCGVAIVVVLAVAIPVGILVVAPKLGQHAVDVLQLHIHNSSFYGIESEGIPTNGTMDLNMTMTSPFFIGAIMHDTVIHLTAYNSQGGNPDDGMWTNGPMGNFTMPKKTITQGDNGVNLTNMTVWFNTSKAADSSMRSFYWLLDAVSGTHMQSLILTATPTITALGLINIKTTFHKEMNCNCIKDSTWCFHPVKEVYPPGNGTLPNSTSVPTLASANSTKLVVGDVLDATFTIFCEPIGGANVSNATAWVDGIYVPPMPTWSDVVSFFTA